MPGKDQFNCGKFIFSPAPSEAFEKQINIKLIINFKTLLENKIDEHLIIYFFSLVANAVAADPPPNIGSDIEIGSGLVFSI